MNPDIAISVKNIKKSFKVYLDGSRYLKEKILFWKRNRFEMRNVLNGISFDIKKGEAVGIIGANGCGKSTTLKLLSRIMYPDEGTVRMNGRVSALIELGAGFHPDMTGRENIYTNAAIFGLSRKEIEERLQTIIDFSELGDYIDNPVRTYSSGMYMRLAFSVAINVNADILLVDEILAVGDAAFQAKCFNKLKKIKAAGTTIVIVSHSLGQIEQICDRSIWIKDGVIEQEGSPREVHPAYMDYMSRLLLTNTSEVKKQAEKLAGKSGSELETGQQDETEESSEDNHAWFKDDTNRWGSGDVRITSVRMLDGEGEETDSFMTESTITIEYHYRVRKLIEQAGVGFGIYRNDGLQCYGTNTFIERKDIDLADGSTIKCVLHDVSLLPGEYSLDVAIHSDGGIDCDYWKSAKTFRIVSGTADVGICRIRHEWTIE